MKVPNFYKLKTGGKSTDNKTIDLYEELEKSQNQSMSLPSNDHI